jgi:protease I
MLKKIAILAANGYEDLELHYPRIRLNEAGFETDVISLQKTVIKGKNGYPIMADLGINNANPENYNGVIVPGGTLNPDYLRRNQKVLDFVKAIDDKGKLTAAICHGGWVLISAKVIKGRRATSFFAIKDDMINAGAKFEDTSVVVDGNLITSRKPEDLPNFMKAILEFLKK